MSTIMHITEELQQKLAKAVLRLRTEGVDETVINHTGLVLVVKNSRAHKHRIETKSQYLGDFRNGGEYLLFSS